jgi:hypothetical protein
MGEIQYQRLKDSTQWKKYSKTISSSRTQTRMYPAIDPLQSRPRRKCFAQQQHKINEIVLSDSKTW